MLNELDNVAASDIVRY